MKKRESVQPVLLCACLAAGLMFDPMGFLRMALLCAAVHESAHVLVFLICTHRLPHLRFEFGGISLSGTQTLSRTAELAVVAAGPIANFVFAAVLLLAGAKKAQYGVYFLAAVSMCTGIYNLLPFGMLDGARILQILVPAGRLCRMERMQRAGMYLFCIAAVCAALCCPMPPEARLAALMGPLWLAVKDRISH